MDEDRSNLIDVDYDDDSDKTESVNDNPFLLSLYLPHNKSPGTHLGVTRDRSWSQWGQVPVTYSTIYVEFALVESWEYKLT